MSSQAPNYRGYRFPSEIISHAVWLYYRFALSFRDVEDLLAQRSITVTYETIRLVPNVRRGSGCSRSFWLCLGAPDSATSWFSDVEIERQRPCPALGRPALVDYPPSAIIKDRTPT